ncbi:MarR family transcriptional regulator [Bradyrhizobium sp. INPA03-11B]|uniref:MarR family winged helix-turn-helix transcriptional regulator n=1 Tax=Bradyrhizobium sp. INPA03-11B TaxID=418598 RepID=UPI00338E3A55
MAKTEPSRCNLTALRKATRRVSQLYDQVLATSGLRGTQRAILVHIRRSGAPTMGELAAALVLDRTALNHNLKPLERDGLLTITVDKDDRRSRLVRLTKRGEARLDESQAAWLKAQDRFETAFGARQAADLRQTLELIAALEFGEHPADLSAS